MAHGRWPRTDYPSLTGTDGRINRTWRGRHSWGSTSRRFVCGRASTVATPPRVGLASSRLVWIDSGRMVQRSDRSPRLSLSPSGSLPCPAPPPPAPHQRPAAHRGRPRRRPAAGRAWDGAGRGQIYSPIRPSSACRAGASLVT